MTTEFRTMLVAPNIGILRQEGRLPKSPFGEKAENPISAIAKELHIHTANERVSITLDNPVRGSLFVANSNGHEELLIPGEQKIFSRENLVLFIRKGSAIQIIFFDADELFS